MPLARAVDHQISLLEEQILPVRHGVQRPLIHIGQLRHGMGLAGEQEALLLLLIEEGVNPLHLKLVIHPLAVRAAAATGFRRLGAVQQSIRRACEGADAEKGTGLDAHRLVQIKILIGFAVHADGQHTEPFPFATQVSETACQISASDWERATETAADLSKPLAFWDRSGGTVPKP